MAPNISQSEAFDRTNPALSWQTSLARKRSQQEPLAMRPDSPGGHLQPSSPRHSEVRSQEDILTGFQAQKTECLISELWEGAVGGLWLLFGQAVEVQSRWSSSGCSRRACFWGEVEEERKSPAHLSAKTGNLASWWL